MILQVSGKVQQVLKKEKVNEVSVEFILALADLVPDAFDADVLEVDLLGVVALDLILEFYQLLDLQRPLLLAETALPLTVNALLLHALLRLLSSLLHPPVEGRHLWHAALLPYGLCEFSTVESHRHALGGSLSLFFERTVGEMLDSKRVFFVGVVEVGRSIHRVLRTRGWVFKEEVALSKGLLGLLLLPVLLAEFVPPTLHRLLRTFLVDFPDGESLAADDGPVTSAILDFLKQVLLFFIAGVTFFPAFVEGEAGHVVGKGHALRENVGSGAGLRVSQAIHQLQ